MISSLKIELIHIKATQCVKWSEMYKYKDDMKHPGYER